VRRGIGHVERDRAHPVAVLREEIGEVLWFARCSHETVARGEHGLRQVAAEAARGSSDEPDFDIGNLLSGVVVSSGASVWRPA